MSFAKAVRSKCCYRRVRVTMHRHNSVDSHCLSREEALNLAADLKREAKKIPEKKKEYKKLRKI